MEAWARGYDKKSARELGGSDIVGSRKWIGACECLTLVRDVTGRRAFVFELERGRHVDGKALPQFLGEWKVAVFQCGFYGGAVGSNWQ